MNFVEQKRPDLQTRTEVTWTNDRVELLKRLWGEGLSASQIAGELGGITRNAVIGKVGSAFPGRASAVLLGAAAARARALLCSARPPDGAGNTALAAQHSYDYSLRPSSRRSGIIPLGQRCSLLDRDDKCHWPIGVRASLTSSSAAARPAQARRIADIGRVARQPPASRRDRRRPATEPQIHA
jgi:GcrA cell cycle regulator